MPEKKPISFYLSKKLIRRLKIHAIECEEYTSTVVTRALVALLEREAPEVRRATARGGKGE